MKKGFTLLEVLVGVSILFILAFLIYRVASSVLQRAKVVTAKAQISQLAQLLEMVKDDTGYYPVNLSDLTVTEPPAGIPRNWRGPYTKEIPIDPWGSAYFYRIPPTTLFNSPALPRTHGQPAEYSLDFVTNAGTAILRIENYGITACSVYLNGVQVVHESEFRRNPRPQIIEKEITLLEGNNFVVWARSQPGSTLVASISSDNVPSKEYFMLGSYGRDREEGGEDFDSDIIWQSQKYPNFQ